jgi:hypothetical protein
MLLATGYHCTRLCDLPFADTLYASTAQGIVTLPFTATGTNTWDACGMFAGGDATVLNTPAPNTCTPGTAGNTPFKLIFTGTPAGGGVPTFTLSWTNCCTGTTPTAVPHFRTDTTCASGFVLQTPLPITIVSCDPVHFQVTVPATVTCPGSTPTLANPMAGTIDFTE